MQSCYIDTAGPFDFIPESESELQELVKQSKRIILENPFHSFIFHDQ